MAVVLVADYIEAAESRRPRHGDGGHLCSPGPARPTAAELSRALWHDRPLAAVHGAAISQTQSFPSAPRDPLSSGTTGRGRSAPRPWHPCRGRGGGSDLRPRTGGGHVHREGSQLPLAAVDHQSSPAIAAGACADVAPATRELPEEVTPSIARQHQLLGPRFARWSSTTSSSQPSAGSPSTSTRPGVGASAGGPDWRSEPPSSSARSSAGPPTTRRPRAASRSGQRPPTSTSR